MDVEGDFSSLNRGIDSVTRGTKSKFAGIGRAAGLGVAAGVAGFAVVAKASVDAAVEAEKSEARLRTQLKASGISYKEHGAEIDRVIQKTSKLAGLDDEDLSDAFTNIVRVTGDVNKSYDLLGTAADFARAKNIDVAKAGEIVGKVAGGNTGILSRYGIVLKEGATTQEALAALQQKFAGQAEAYGKTTAGAQDRFRVAVENLQEKLGAFLLPVLEKVTNAAAKLVDDLMNGTGVFANVSGYVDRLRDAFRGAGDSAGGMSQVIEAAKGVFTSLKDIVVSVADIAGAAWDKFGFLVVDWIGDMIGTISGLAQAVTTTLQGITDFIAGVFTGDWSRAWDGIKNIFAGVWKGFVTIVDAAWEAVKRAVALSLTALAGLIKSAGAPFVEAGKFIINRIAEGVRTVTDALASVGGWLRNRVSEIVRAVAGGFTEIGAWVINRVADGITTVTELLASVGGWIKNRVFDFARNVSGGFVEIGTWIVNRVADGITTVTETLSSIGGWIKNRIFEFARKVGSGFEEIGGFIIDKIVDGLKGGANAFVGFVNKLIGVINKIPGVDIGEVKGFARGGVLNGPQELARGGKVNRPMAIVGEEAPRHPEYVIPTNPMYRKRAMNLFGQLAGDLGVDRERIALYARGGLLGSKGGPLDSIGSIAGLPLKAITKGASWFIDQLPNPADLLPDWLVGTGRFAIREVTKWIKDKVGSILPDFGGGGGGKVGGKDPGGFSAITSLASRFGLQVTSGFRPGDPGWHGKNRARDYSNSTGPTPQMMAFAKTMASNFGSKLLELIYTPLGFGIKNGSRVPNSFYSSVLADHYNHVHVAMALGGLLHRLGFQGGTPVTGPFVGSYATGGVIPRTGLAQVHAGETVLPAGVQLHADIYIGGQRIDEMVEVKLERREQHARQTYRAGVLPA